MRELGLRVHPNTDDPTLHHVTPTGAWLMMARDFGYSIDDLRRCLDNGLDARVDRRHHAPCMAHRVACARFDALRAQHLPGALRPWTC